MSKWKLVDIKYRVCDCWVLVGFVFVWKLGWVLGLVVLFLGGIKKKKIEKYSIVREFIYGLLVRWIFKNINEIDFKGLVKYWILCRNYMYSYSKKKKKNLGRFVRNGRYV